MSSEEKFKFYAPVKVRYDDTDKQGHVYFGKYYSFFDEGLEAYLDAIGYDYKALEADEADFLFAESKCNYKSPARWPEMLHVHTRVGHIGNRSLRFDFQIYAQANGRLIATGHIVAVTAHHQTFELCPVPDGLRRAVAAYEGEPVTRDSK